MPMNVTLFVTSGFVLIAINHREDPDRGLFDVVCRPCVPGVGVGVIWAGARLYPAASFFFLFLLTL